MTQQSQAVPMVTANIAGNRQQINLRDYLNQRVAPFLKKAIHESLGIEAEYPLQWLGEHLIQQSILYEGNPDATKIQERFAYKHDATAPQTISATPLLDAPSPTVPTLPVDDNGADDPVTDGAPVDVSGDVSDFPAAPRLNDSPAAPRLNGGVEDVAGQDMVTRDTEMSGTT